MMGALALRDIASELDAAYRGADIAIEGVATDSRKINSGDLYIALRGERFDGHAFVDEVAAKGAAAAVVDHAVSDATQLPQLKVADTRAALGLIARMNRRSFSKPLLAITGSAGKTTCKEMLAAILAQRGAVLATRGNLNNEIGVPLTLLNIAPQHDFAVIEMGAARVGDIAYLCRFAEPDVAVVTAALPAHLEGFGDVDTVASTKGEIFSGLRANGVAIIDADNKYFALWRRLAGARRIVTFGFGEHADVSARAVARNATGVQFELHAAAGNINIELPLLGSHNVRNALAAAAAALTVGVTLENIRAGLAQVKPMSGRLQPRRDRADNIVIDDSYNANPGAVRAAIDVLAEYAGTRRLILGNMAELGAQAQALHCEVARYAAERGIEQCWFIGPYATLQATEYTRHNSSVSAQVFADNRAVIAAYLQQSVACEQQLVDATLIKGSRSAGMEEIVAAICADAINGGGR